MTDDSKSPMDHWLLLYAFLLMVIGLVLVYSTTGSRFGDELILRQLSSCLAGVISMLAFSKIDLIKMRDSSITIYGTYIFFIFLLCAVFFFESKNGANRWIILWKLSVQPSEFFKLFSVILTSWYMFKCHDLWKKRQDYIPKLVVLFILLLIPLTLIYREPDMGTTFLVIGVSLTIIFLGGVPKWLFACSLPILLVAGFVFVTSKPYRLQRVQTFLNPTLDTKGTGYQSDQGLIAIGKGGWHGVGLGGGQQQMYFLPEAHTDFIYAIIGEETGLIGTSTVLALFMAVLWRGYRIARRARDSFLRLCAGGFVLLLVAQALMNISVVLSMVPNKGITLPFISYGGSSLVASFMCIGLLLNISRETS